MGGPSEEGGREVKGEGEKAKWSEGEVGRRGVVRQAQA